MKKQRITSGIFSLIIAFVPSFYEPFHDGLIKLFQIPPAQEALVRGAPILLGLMVYVVWAAIYDSHKMKSEKQILLNTNQKLRAGPKLAEAFGLFWNEKKYPHCSTCRSPILPKKKKNREALWCSTCKDFKYGMDDTGHKMGNKELMRKIKEVPLDFNK